MADANPRLAELRRRIQSDPAPFVFAQLAEEYRYAGRLSEAVECAREGLARYPGYVLARLILSRSLAALARWDEATEEYERLAASAPDNLAALRELAAILERQGQPEKALHYYRQALALARNDRDLETAVERLSAAATSEDGAAPVRPVDFDALLSTLGRPNQPAPPLVEQLLTDPLALLPRHAEPEAGSGAGQASDSDPLARLEATLRQRLDASPSVTLAPAPVDTGSTAGARAARIDAAVIAALQAWLAALAADRHAAGRP